MTIQDLLEERARRRQVRKDIGAEITELQEEVERLEDEAKKKAEDGNESGFFQLKEQVMYDQGLIELKQIRMDAISENVDEVDVLKAWQGFRKEHDERFDEAMLELTKAKASFLQAYEHIFYLQNEGLHVREQARVLAGYPDGTLGHEKAERTFSMKVFPVWDINQNALAYHGRNFAPDTAYFMAMSDIDDHDISFVMVSHRPVLLYD